MSAASDVSVTAVTGEASVRPDDSGMGVAPALPGLDPRWSRVVVAPDADGVARRWHVLDTGMPEGTHLGTMLCVHGNPTWSYLWRRFLAQVRPGWRVVAVDQLGMGYSEDPAGTLVQPRTLARRIEDLDRLTDALGLSGPVVAVGHDWGGIVVSGWAARHRGRRSADPTGVDEHPDSDPSTGSVDTAGSASPARADGSSEFGGSAGITGSAAPPVSAICADAVAGPWTAGLVLANTAVHHDFSAGLPTILRPARALAEAVCVRTPTFVRGATAVSRSRPPREIRDAFAAPYRHAADRTFVGQFVADIPLEPDHPSRATFEEVADGLSALGADLPALLLRGPGDPVFSEEHLRDLQRRLPRADVHRYEGASHLVTEDAPRSAGDTWDWIAARVEPLLTSRPDARPDRRPASGPDDPGDALAHPANADHGAEPASGGHVDGGHSEGRHGEHGHADDGHAMCPDTSSKRCPDEGAVSGAAQGVDSPAADLRVDPGDGPAWSALLERVRDTPDELAVAEVASGRRMTFAQLEDDIAAVAAGLAADSIRPGQRVAMLVPPGIDLTVALYACWRIGAVVVVADAGLGARGMGRALRGAGVDHVIGIGKGLVAVAALRVPGRRILVGPPPPLVARAVRVDDTLDAVRRRGAALPAPALPPTDAEAAVLFTSGATGPAKGVVYRSDQIRAQAGGIRGIYGLSSADRFVAAFAPFALYGPAMGVGSAVPDMDVTAPATLTAAKLADAVIAAEATTVFASPSSLRNVVATADDLDPTRREALERIRVAMSAGAPIPISLLHQVQRVLPNAVLHTPYGMTECLPVADVELPELERAYAGSRDGVCVGRPLPGVDVWIAPLPADPADPDGELTTEPGVTGEIVVRAAHVKDRYDQLWATQHDSARDETERLDGSGGLSGTVDPDGSGSLCGTVDPDGSSALGGTVDPGGSGRHGGTVDPGGAGAAGGTTYPDDASHVGATRVRAARTHRTGDVGHLDVEGRLWVEGRRVHVVHTAGGPLTPVALEVAVQEMPEVGDAAVVGVGPVGTQAVVVIVTPPAHSGHAGQTARPFGKLWRRSSLRTDGRRPRTRNGGATPRGLADADLTREVRQVGREVAGVDVAAVLTTAAFPVDIRHQSKVDRTRLARWAERVLAGGRVGTP